ncbi:MAG: hypothetical protein RL091_118 [Verrucomicrobiota bacterium]|jgi:hypothetical protein
MLVSSLLVFLLLVGGGSVTLAARLDGFSALVRLSLGAGATLIGLYLAGLTLYLTGLDWHWLWIWPAVMAGLSWSGRHQISQYLSEPMVLACIVGWTCLALWSLGLQALIFSYSGGIWSIDWVEHYERAMFFVNRWPTDHIFVANYLLPARPPLANVVEASVLALTSTHFAQYQIVTTLLSTLVFLPMAALTQLRGPAPRALGLLVLLLMLNPLFAQNATFAWTKLPAAFFVLLAAALIFSQPAHQARLTWIKISFTGGILTHYSVAPWVIALGCGWLASRGWTRPDAAQRRDLVRGGICAGVLALSWFGWMAFALGPEQLIFATSTFGQAPGQGWLHQLSILLTNIRQSIVPNFDSPEGGLLLGQTEILGRIRDGAFVYYQTNLLVSFGVGNLCVLGWLAVRQTAGDTRRFWLVTGFMAVLTGIGVHSQPNALGLAHICLQPLVLLGLVWLARCAGNAPRWLRFLWIAGLVTDFLLGIVLHFGLQSLALLRWLMPDNTDGERVYTLSRYALVNLKNKAQLGQPFLADLLANWHPFIMAGLAGVLLLTIWRWRQAGHPVSGPGTGQF